MVESYINIFRGKIKEEGLKWTYYGHHFYFHNYIILSADIVGLFVFVLTCFLLTAIEIMNAPYATFNYRSSNQTISTISCSLNLIQGTAFVHKGHY